MRPMSSRRSRLRRTATLALVALMLSAVPRAGAQGHVGAPGFSGQADFCSATGGNPQPATPAPPNRSQRTCAHCDACAGRAGNGWALPPGWVTSSALPARLIAPVAFALPPPIPAHEIAARPRGPPFSA